MIPHRTMTRFAAALLLATAPVAFSACKGSNGSTTSSGPVAAFAPDAANPAPGSIAMLQGTVSGANIDVRVTVTGVPSFFGAAFRVSYDPTALQFNGLQTTSSLLRANGVTDTNLLFVENHTSTPGEIVITATRVNPTVAPPIDVTATSDLVVLNFTARLAIVAASVEGRLEIIDPRFAYDGSITNAGPGTINVSWFGGGVSAQ
jgi:hypothetical protein